MEMYFYPVASKFSYVTVNTEAAREHVGDIEREIIMEKNVEDSC